MRIVGNFLTFFLGISVKIFSPMTARNAALYYKLFIIRINFPLHKNRQSLTDFTAPEWSCPINYL